MLDPFWKSPAIAIREKIKRIQTGREVKLSLQRHDTIHTVCDHMLKMLPERYQSSSMSLGKLQDIKLIHTEICRISIHHQQKIRESKEIIPFNITVLIFCAVRRLMNPLSVKLHRDISFIQLQWVHSPPAPTDPITNI